MKIAWLATLVFGVCLTMSCGGDVRRECANGAACAPAHTTTRDCATGAACSIVTPVSPRPAPTADTPAPYPTATPGSPLPASPTPNGITPTVGAAIALGPPATDTPTAIPIDPSHRTGIAGYVTLGPTCPVQRIDSPCPDRPYAATFEVRNAAGDRVAEIQSGDDGRFFIALPPGSYVLAPQSSNVYPHAQPQTVTVVDGQVAAVPIVYDSGIR